DEKLEQTDTIRVGTQVNQYVDFATIGGTGCELYNLTPFAPSIFQCAVGLLMPADQPAAITAVNDVDPGAGSCGGALCNGALALNAPGQGQQADRWTVHAQNWAIFTHDQFNITDRLRLRVGARYNSETKDLGATLASASNSCATLQALENATVGLFQNPVVPQVHGAGPSGGVVTFLDINGFSTPMGLACNPAINTISNGLWSGSADEHSWSYLASLSYRITDGTMAYAGYSRGYKAGGYNVDRQGFDVFPSQTAT